MKKDNAIQRPEPIIVLSPQQWTFYQGLLRAALAERDRPRTGRTFAEAMVPIPVERP